MQAMELVADFRHSTGLSKLVLPLKDSELESRSDSTFYDTETRLSLIQIVTLFVS